MNKENKIEQLHEQAMDLCEGGFFARREKDDAKAVDFFKKAFEFEKQAALLMEDDHDCEPTRGVLFRSAGWIAIDAGFLDEAEEMVLKGLQGKNLHNEIHDELKEVLEEIIKIKTT